MWNKDNFYKDGLFYRSKSPQWEIDLYGFAPNGLGDLIYNTLRMIIETNDKSQFALDSFILCYDILDMGKRWPDYLNPPVIDGKKPYRSQTSMTIDPWIAFYACAVYLGEEWLIKTKPPFKLYRPEVWAWRRALLNKRNWYPFWRFMTPATKDYVQDLDLLMEWAYNKKH